MASVLWAQWACAVSWTPFTPGWVTMDPCPGVGEGEVSALTSNSQFKLMEAEGIAPKIGTSKQCQKLILAFGYNILRAYKQVAD